MTLPFYRALYARFKEHPPVGWMVAAWLGIGKTKTGTQGDLEALYSAMTGQAPPAAPP